MDCNEDDVHALHVSNELQFARLFMDVARKSYNAGNIEAGKVALARATAAYSGARRLAAKLPEKKRESIWADLAQLEGALALISATNATQHATNNDADLEITLADSFSF
jgi:hypothetical protein